MSEFNQLFNSFLNRNNELTESVIDMPRNSLDPTVFEFPDEGMPFFRPAIKVQILETVEAINRIVPVNDCYVVGSILTKQYSASSDIDVNVEVDPMEGMGREAVYLLTKRKNGELAVGTTHPINFFIVEGEYDVDKSQAAYDVANERWLKEPENDDVQVVAYLDKFQDAVGHIDLTIGSLRRNIIDYDELRSLDKSQIKQLGSLVKNKLEEIEADMEFLIQTKQQTVEQRRAAFSREMTPEEIKKYGKKYKLPENVIYKMLEKYYYLDFIKIIKNLLADGELSDSDIRKVKDLGKKQWSFENYHYIHERKNRDKRIISKYHKDPLNRHSMKGIRGVVRKTQQWTPVAHKLKGGRQHYELGYASKPIQIAKDSKSGIWRVSTPEARSIADFYHINLPNEVSKAKQLGKTKIILWLKKPGQYFLVKPPKRD
jgi:hypothetical protein